MDAKSCADSVAFASLMPESAAWAMALASVSAWANSVILFRASSAACLAASEFDS